MEDNFCRLAFIGRVDCGNVDTSIIFGSVDYYFCFLKRVTLDRNTMVPTARGKSMDIKTAVGWCSWVVGSMAAGGYVLRTG